MNRRKVLKRLGLFAGAITMSKLSGVASFLDELPESNHRMPVLFVGHGNPMNAVEENEFTKGWRTMANGIEKPTAIVCISAHWETKGTKVTAMQNPRMIYDMYGFPQKLYDVKYQAQGHPKLAKDIIDNVKFTKIQEDHDWGFDHGTWSVLTKLFPQADIPCIQLSLDRTRDLNYHFELAKELVRFRKKGVLFVASGNIVHNIGVIMQTGNRIADWAIEFDKKVAECIEKQDYSSLIKYDALGKMAQLSVNSAEHYIPMLYALALREKGDAIKYFNHEKYETLMGAGMRSFKLH